MSAPARRQVLQSVRPQQYTHIGLWFDKYLQQQKEETLEPHAQHIQQTGQIAQPPEYALFFERWKEALQKMGAACRVAEVVGRVAAGLGGESVIENGMTLHRTYGVPFIPGSSLKGAARAYATAVLDGEWGKTPDDAGNDQYGGAFVTLFGSSQRAGVAAFFDALPLPGSWGIHNEVMTVHHPDYYQDKKQPPADWDSPTPIPFPAVHGRFLIALYAPTAPMWAMAGMNIVQLALSERGVGGKTSSGYGRFDLTELPLSAEEQAAQAFINDLEALPANQVAGRIHSFYTRWRDIELEQLYKEQVAQAILDKIETAGRVKQSQDKAWYVELVQFAEADKN